MKKALIYLTLTDLVFLLILSLSSFFEGITGRILYYSAFVIPLVLALVIKRFDKDGKLAFRQQYLPCVFGMLIQNAF